MQITSVLITLNDEKNIHKCLQSLKKSGVSKIIVVDGGSTDLTRTICKKFTKNIYKTRKGLGYQTFYGIKKAKSKYVVLVEADHIYPKNFFKRLYKKYLIKKPELISAPVITKYKEKNFFTIGQKSFMKIHYLQQKKSSYPTIPLLSKKRILENIYQEIKNIDSFGIDTSRAEVVKKKKFKFYLSEIKIYENSQLNFKQFLIKMKNYAHGDYEFYNLYRKKESPWIKLKSISHVFLRYGLNYPLRSILKTNPFITIPYLWLIMFFRYYFWIQRIFLKK